MSTPKTYESWYRDGVAAAIPWLAGGPNGQAEAGSWPRLLDDIVVNQLTQARYQAFPDKCAADALPHLGADRKLIQGANETNDSFRIRLKDVWGQWARAGTPCSVLEQLYYFGLSGASWIQQNGLQYTLSGAPTPGADPTSLVVASNTAVLASTLTSNTDPLRKIPAGTPWFALSGNTDLTNIFEIQVPSWPFAALSVAYFNNSDTATVTWPFQFGDTTYTILYGTPSAPVVLSVDGPSKTTTGFNLLASAPWTGSVWVIGFATSVNPLNTFSFASLGALKSIIQTFRPNALCAGVYAVQSGHVWGQWTWGTGNWGGSVSTILGAF